MTYLQFHYIFNIPVFIGLLLASIFLPQCALASGDFFSTALVLVAVMIFTAPWDNLAAKWGIWGFAEGRYWFKILYLPIEEYSFFVIQSLNVILLFHLGLHLHAAWLHGFETHSTVLQYICMAVSLPVWLMVGVCLRFVRRHLGPKVNYANHLAWFLPVIYAQWVIAPPLFWAYFTPLLVVTLAFGTYYTVADIIAVRSGIWYLDDNQTTGFKLLNILPWEESAFFYLTSLLVAQSYLLLLPSDCR